MFQPTLEQVQPQSLAPVPASVGDIQIAGNQQVIPHDMAGDSDAQNEPVYQTVRFKVHRAPEEEEPERRVSTRDHTPTTFYNPTTGHAYVHDAEDADLLTTVSEALSRPEAEKWRAAINDELRSMDKKQVYELVELPTGR